MINQKLVVSIGYLWYNTSIRNVKEPQYRYQAIAGKISFHNCTHN